jgi:hypothetical protein
MVLLPLASNCSASSAGQVLVGGASDATLDRIRQDKAIRIAYRDDDRRLLRCSSAFQGDR